MLCLLQLVVSLGGHHGAFDVGQGTDYLLFQFFKLVMDFRLEIRL